ncbi:hypothetical protein SO694_000313105 [Aureococcus anophagefferens]|uniref:Uncharacterized protein n=1 Tax=Aureococcus anophagefferens TaxID=44056 RepID=A0ABR1FJU7_AURAN
MVNTLKGFRKWRSLKGSDMAALIGKRSSVMGKFWDGCSKDDEDKLYPCVIKEYDDRKKIARIAALQQMLVKYVTENNGKSLLAVNKWTCLDNFTAGDPPCGRMLIDERARRRAAQRPHREVPPGAVQDDAPPGETKAGGKTIVSADGSLITRLKFEDALNYHADWVLAVMDELMTEAADAKISAPRLRRGRRLRSWQLDMMTSCGVAYVTLNLSFVDDEKSGFVHKNVQLAYEEFRGPPHGQEHRGGSPTPSLHGIDIENVGAPTIDGAANGKRAMKILKLAFRICAFHQGMRCVHYAPPLALKAMFKVFKKLALYTTKESTKFNEAMKAAQRACGIVSEPQPALNMLNPADTRATARRPCSSGPSRSSPPSA